MALTMYARQRIVFYHTQGKKAPTITKLLQKEGIIVSRTGVHNFIEHYKRTGTLRRSEGSGRPFKATPVVQAIIDEEMSRDDETTATQLHKILTDRGRVGISNSTYITV